MTIWQLFWRLWARDLIADNRAVTTVDGLGHKQMNRAFFNVYHCKSHVSFIHTSFILVTIKPSMQIMQRHACPRRKTNDADSTPPAKVIMHRRRVSISSRTDARFLNTLTRLILVAPCNCLAPRPIFLVLSLESNAYYVVCCAVCVRARETSSWVWHNRHRSEERRVGKECPV